MVCNVAFLTERGVRYFEVEDLDIRKLADTLVLIKKDQEPGAQ